MRCPRVVPVLVLAAATLAPGAAGATVRAWTPPDADSLVHWAAEARARFRSNAGDSVGGANYAAYDRVGRMGRRLLHALGRDGMTQAHAIEPVLDSLGLDTEVALDPAWPGFALLMVRNPHRLTAQAVGYLYWYRHDELRMQGALFGGGASPSMRVWWTGRRERPYAWGIIERDRAAAGQLRLTVLGLQPDGAAWTVVQHEGQGQILGEPGHATWVEIDGDGVPEIAHYTPVEPDSLLRLCAGCDPPVAERLFVQRPEGFVLHDSRVLPSPLVTFMLFARRLADGHADAARVLLADPAMLERAIAEGWDRARASGSWELEYVERDVSWPRWLALRFRGDNGAKRYVVHFVQRDSRWLVSEWIPVQPPRDAGAPPVGR